MIRPTLVQRTLSRRSLMSTTGALAAAALVGGCRPEPPGFGALAARPLSRRPFVPPRVSMDRIVRVIVGLRPFRPSGFVVRREDIGSKALVHNYGHGGGGISLAWGSSGLAVREVAGERPRAAAVVGAGIMGLTTAALLQDAGWQVTIYSRSPPHHSTSNVGGGQWAATSVFDEDVATDAFKAQYIAASRIAHHAYQNLVGAGYGVKFIENYYLLGDAPTPAGVYLRETPELFTSVTELGPGEHPFPVAHVRRAVSMLIQPAQFLRRVWADFQRAGGRFELRDFGSGDEVLSLRQDVIFNCTGLGAKFLFDDEELTPIKGQLVFIPPDPAVDFMTIGGGSGVTYMFPRAGEILLGGSYQKGDWSRHPEPEVTERIVTDNKAIFDAMA